MAQISDLDVCIPGQIVYVERNGMSSMSLVRAFLELEVCGFCGDN